MKQEFNKKTFVKIIPRMTSAPAMGVYDEMNEEWMMRSKDEIVNLKCLAVGEVARFVNTVLKEMSRLDTVYNIDKVIFDLNIEEQGVRFTTNFKKEGVVTTPKDVVDVKAINTQNGD